MHLSACAIQGCPLALLPAHSECMGKTFQAATTNTWELFDHRWLLQNIFLISAKLNFHQPLVCSTICPVQYYIPEVGGSSVWQISKKKHLAGSMVKNLSCVSCAAWNDFSINSLPTSSHFTSTLSYFRWNFLPCQDLP